MSTFETNGNGQALLPSGVYVHPDSGEELVTQATGKFGNPQADAITRLGFVYVGPAKFTEAKTDGKKAELVQPVDPTAGPIADTKPATKTVAELESELEAAKEREAKLEKASNSKSSLVDKKAVKEAKAEDSQPENQPEEQAPEQKENQ